MDMFWKNMKSNMIRERETQYPLHLRIIIEISKISNSVVYLYKVFER